MSPLKMTFKKPFTISLVKSGFFKPKPMVVLDIGARGDFEELWSLFYGDQVNFIGFEPDEKECEKLNYEWNTRFLVTEPTKSGEMMGFGYIS